ncbi:MAG: alpha/beta fold hydrolase [Thermodesulfobacteriota bacterium]|nr:alpha/beta fold hydrolase [Thermodesulfobacteriota bacterium]
MSITRVFIHGLESSSGGTKGTYFRKRYPDMIVKDYFGTLDERMNKLNDTLTDKKDLILVGSSYGGLMASIYACENEWKLKKLILLAPALDLGEFEPYLSKKLDIPVIAYHGSQDDVVPLEPVKKIATLIFPNISYNTVNDDHPLSTTFPTFDWDNLMEINV